MNILVQLSGNMYPVLCVEARGKTTHSPRQTGAAFAVRSTNGHLPATRL